MNKGLFEPTVMFFRLTNLPAKFQAMMNTLVHDLIMQRKVVIYRDDILIFTEDLTEHCIIIEQVLDILRINKLYLKQTKCEIEKSKIKYLGMILGHGKVRIDPNKVNMVAEWPIPKTKKEVQKFLGFTNFYCHFTKEFSGVVKPITKLTGNELWKWGTEHEEAFKLLHPGVKPPIGMNMYQTIFALFLQLPTRHVKLCSFNQTLMTVCTQSRRPEKPGHMSFHIKYSAAHAKARHTFHYGTEGGLKGLGMAATSCMAIYGIKRFDFRVACPLCALLSKNLLMLWIFPFA